MEIKRTVRRQGEKLIVEVEEGATKRAALLDADGNVVNVIVVDAEYDLAVGWDGYRMVDGATASPGDIHDGVKFTRPAPKAQPKTRTDELAEKLRAKTITAAEKDELLLLLAGG